MADLDLHSRDVVQDGVSGATRSDTGSVGASPVRTAFSPINEPFHSSPDGLPQWQQRIWTGCSRGLLTVIAALFCIVIFTLWQILLLLQTKDGDNAFVFAGITLVTVSLFRLLAILIGGAIAFVGLAVSFFAHQNVSTVNAELAQKEYGTAKAALATQSPGIVAVIIGAAVIVCALFARGTHTYQPPIGTQVGPVQSQSNEDLTPLHELLEEEPGIIRAEDKT